MAQTTAAEPKAFSATDVRFMTAFFSNMKSKPEVDWDKVAQDAALKDSRCAKDRFRQILAKHDIGGGSPDGTPRKARKAGVAADGGKAGIPTLKAMPTSVKKRAPRKKAVKKKKVESDDEFEEEKKEEVKEEVVKEEDDEDDELQKEQGIDDTP